MTCARCLRRAERYRVRPPGRPADLGRQLEDRHRAAVDPDRSADLDDWLEAERRRVEAVLERIVVEDAESLARVAVFFEDMRARIAALLGPSAGRMCPKR